MTRLLPGKPEAEAALASSRDKQAAARKAAQLEAEEARKAREEPRRLCRRIRREQEEMGMEMASGPSWRSGRESERLRRFASGLELSRSSLSPGEIPWIRCVPQCFPS